MRFLILALLLVLSCNSPTYTSDNVSARSLMMTSSAASASQSDCYDPKAFGAIPNDEVSDREAIQKAIDEAQYGGTVCLGAGRWRIDPPALGTTYNRYAGLSTHGTNVTIGGFGSETILEVVGPIPTTFYVVSIDPSASNVSLRNITIDTSLATAGGEQFHAVQIGSGVCSGETCKPISHITLDNVTIRHPRVDPAVRRGDCVRMLGNTEATRVEHVDIVKATFSTCARSGVAVQRNVRGLKIALSTFLQATDQDIDYEPTGSTTTTTSDGWLTLIGNQFHDVRSVTQGDWSVTVAGDGITIADNHFNGRGIKFYRARRVVMHHNVIDAEMIETGGVLDVGNVFEDVLINNNIIRRRGKAGAVIRVVHASGSAATNLKIFDNIIRQDTANHGIYMESASNVALSGNKLFWSAPATGFTAMYLRSTIRDVDSIRFENNDISSIDLAFAIQLYADTKRIGRVRATDNESTGTKAGLRCSVGTGGAIDSVLSANNAIGTKSCTALAPTVN